MTPLIVAAWQSPKVLQAGTTLLNFQPVEIQCQNDPTEIVYVDGPNPQGWPIGAFAFEVGGWFAVNLQVSMVPGTPMEGQFLWRNANNTGWHQYLLPFKVGSGYTLQGNTIVFKANANESWGLAAVSPAPCTINHDERATKLSIWKVSA